MMATLAVFDIGKKKVSDLELDDRVFGLEVNPALLHEAVRKNLASQRKGTACTKNRTDVRGGGAKPWKQKGTGRARAGSRRSPLWRGGGTIFGPTPRGYAYSIPKKVKTSAIRVALSMKHKEGRLMVLDEFPIEGFKTRQVHEILKNLQVENALIVTDQKNVFLERSARNIPGIQVMRCEGLNVYDILNHEHLILLSPVIQKIQGAFAS
jgi:large subunit ribosomal protein L4